MNSKKPASAGFFLADFSVHLEGLLLMYIWMQRNRVNGSWLNDDVSNGLMCFKRATAIDILTLVIAFFGVNAQVTT